jgi:Zn-dependent protease
MMTDPLTWSPINLGRWAGTQVRVHFFLILFVAVTLLSAAVGSGPKVHHPATLGTTACWLTLLLLALALHEFGHAAMAWWLGAEPEEVRLWPLGNMVGPSHPARSPESLPVALAGPAASAAAVIVSAVALSAMGAQFVWNPFGSHDPKGAVLVESGAPYLPALGKFASPYTPAWWVGWFGYLNWVILLANLLPALPFDGGRAFRSYLAQSSVSSGKDSLIAPWSARSCVFILVIVGLVRLLSGKSDGLTLIVLAILIELMVRSESRMLEDGGFFDDGVFGYDFSEGYTSLEGSPAKVRPYRESALKRWRRRRSDLRRQRRQAKEAAEERRMDEILDKLYHQGRSALSDEENRFLIRVSAKYRNRPRAHD